MPNERNKNKNAFSKSFKRCRDDNNNTHSHVSKVDNERRRRISPLSFISPPESPATTKLTSPSLKIWNHPPLEESFVITQSSDSEMEMDDEESSIVHTCASPLAPPMLYPSHRKRARIDGNYTFSMERTKLIDYCKDDVSTKKGHEWWKRRPKQETPKPNTCFICHSPTPLKDSERDIPCVTQQEEQKNSLFSYFQSQSLSSSSKGQKCQQIGQGSKSMSPSSCHYCERISCQSCTITCERCSGRFCKFCSTINYDGPVERTFCLDCETMEGGIDDDISME